MSPEFTQDTSAFTASTSNKKVPSQASPAVIGTENTTLQVFNQSSLLDKQECLIKEATQAVI